jgi:hypothetical protein
MGYELLRRNGLSKCKKLLLLLYFLGILQKLRVGAIGTSYMHGFDLYIIYFHISMGVFPEESLVSGSGILWQYRHCAE